MNPELHHAISQRLLSEFGLKYNHDRTKLNSGECPSCKQKTLWAFADAPWMVRCNRLNKCGYEEHIKVLYDDLFNSWSDRHPVTPTNPNAAADAYLRDARGFDIEKIKGWYAQESYFDDKQKIGSATVRFKLPEIGYFERIIDQPWRFGDRKATFNGHYKGKWWNPPGQDLSQVQEIWLVEGIFDAIALWLHGIPVVATFSAPHYPEDALKALIGLTIESGRPTLVWALDGDKAGTKCTKQWVVRARAEGWPCEAATIPQHGSNKLDWNDLHQRDKLSVENLEDYRYHGAFLIAKDQHEKARLIYLRKNWTAFHLDFENRLYWFSLDLPEYHKALEEITGITEEGTDVIITDLQRIEALKKAAQTVEILNCHPVPLYNEWNQKTEDVFYYFSITLPNEKIEKLTFTNGQLASSPEFLKRLLAVTATWEGSQKQLIKIVKHWTEGIKQVETFDHIGYIPRINCYMLNVIAIKDGKTFKLNDEDYFVIDKRTTIKPPKDLINMELNRDKSKNKQDWLPHYITAFGDKGIIILAYWLGAAFVSKIVGLLKIYPILGVFGAPGTGKSTCGRFMWKLYGRKANGGAEYEGFDPMKASPSGYRRNMGQSTWPVVLVEADRENLAAITGRMAKSFDWDSLKDATGHGMIGARGIKDNTNRTQEFQFLGSLVVIQNAKIPTAFEAIQERLLDLDFAKSDLSEETNRSAEFVEQQQAEDVSYFLYEILLKDKELFEHFSKRYGVYFDYLAKKGIKNYRVRKCHAILQALIECLPKVLPIEKTVIDSALEYVEKMAKTKEASLGKEHPILEEFWSVFDYLESTEEFKVDHSNDDALIAINPNEFEQMASLARQRISPISEIKRLLKDSRIHKFQQGAGIDNPRTMHSPLRLAKNRKQEMHQPENRVFLSTSVKCWIFEK